MGVADGAYEAAMAALLIVDAAVLGAAVGSVFIGKKIDRWMAGG